MNEIDEMVTDIVRQEVRPFAERVIESPGKVFSLKISARQGEITGSCIKENSKHKK